MHKIWKNRPEALQVGGPGENNTPAQSIAVKKTFETLERAANGLEIY